MNVRTPNRSFLQHKNAAVLERSFIITKKKKKIRTSLLWGFLNTALLSYLFYDISLMYSYGIYIEYFSYILILTLTINIIYHICKIVSLFKLEPVVVTSAQKKLLGVADTDPNYTIVDKPQTSPKLTEGTANNSLQDANLTQTPMNTSAVSWRSNLTPQQQSDSLNYSMSSPSWIYHKGTPSPHTSKPNQSIESPPRDTSGIDFISDESDLEKYLKDYEMHSNSSSLANQSQQPTNLLSSFWSHPVTKTAKDTACFLRNCRYQLSIESPTKALSGSPKGKNEDRSPVNDQNSALLAWSRMNVDIVALTKWNENLRKWLSQTILERLVKEFDNINDCLENQGLSDIKIGRVGLDRLRKTAQTTHIAQFLPSLSTLIPFLEATPNQEYLEKRIRELSRGGCMSEFKWNSGSSFNGKDWEPSLPTDSEIIMHLLASYMDTQLLPLPNMPNIKPFTGFHYIKYKEKIPDLLPSSLFIQQVSLKPPYYQVIVGKTIFEMVKGYSNLFHCILFFLYNVNKTEHGVLGRVYLGRGGVNMLWIIDQ